MNISFSLPSLPQPFDEEFFAGAWHPTESLQIIASTSSAKLDLICERNWALIGSIDSPSAKSLLHRGPSRDNSQRFKAIAFRGYLVNPLVHTWSDPAKILTAWATPKPPFNGSFAAVRVGGDSLELTTDVLGISPLYYRMIDQLVLFATNPRLLCCTGDDLNRIVGKTLIHSRFAWGDSGLTAGVTKVPPASRLTFTADAGVRKVAWFDYGSLPPGDEPITKQSLEELEDSFQTATDRLLQLGFGNVAIPLSGGNDSRRILAAMVSRNQEFTAYTVRVFHDGRDMDARFAAQLAQHFRFPHRIIDLPLGSDFARLDRLRRTLVDGEGIEHTWWAAMGLAFPHGTMLFDGLVGDITGYSFYNAREATGDLESLRYILNRGFWPPFEEVQNYLSQFLTPVPDSMNRDTLTFLLLRTRSGPGFMATRLLPIGNLAVFPFMDLDYFYQSLRFRPADKSTKETALQQRCLTEFWPEYAAFPSTRNPPAVEPRFRDAQAEQWASCLRQLNSEAGYPFYGNLRKALTVRARILASAAPFSAVLSRRIRWWLESFLTLAARQRLQRPVWNIQ